MPTTWTTVTDPIGDTGAFDSRMIFGDFDGDGDIDILYQNGNAAGVGIGYMQNNGDGTFVNYTDATAAGSIFVGVDFSGRQISPANFFILDFDGDGDLDILDRTSSTTTFFRNNGNAGFTRITDPAPDTGSFDQRMVWGDFDGDGDVDALYQNGNTAGAGIGYLRNDGGLSFTNFTNAAAAGTPFTGVDFTGLQVTTSTFVVDVDDDGDMDILDRGATQVMYRNDGGTMVRTADVLADIGSFDARMIFGDFDSDGDTDAIYQNGNTAGAGFGYFRNDGGTFTNFTSLTGTPFAGLDLTSQQLTTWTAVDIDGDGDVDIVDRDQSGGGLVLYRQNGAPPTLVSATPSDNSTGVGLNANITLTFSESVTKGNGNIYIYRGDGTLIETIAIGSAQVTGSGTTWTIDPSVTLAGLTNYYIRMDQETFADSEGAVFAGINNNTTLNFTTLAPNTAPTFTNLNGDTIAFTEGTAVRLDTGNNATVADAEQANFNGGTLTVSITANEVAGQDVLGVANIGTGAGQIGVFGSTITYQGVSIGTFTGGTGGADLVITLDGDSTPAATQALVRALTYNNTSDAPNTANRTVTVVLTDGAGGTSTTQTVTVGLTAVNDPHTGGAAITGTATENQTLTAVSTLGDADGLGTLHYDWQRDTGSGFVSIGAADQATYTLGDADVGGLVRVVISYTDAGGTVESAISAASTAIVGVNDPHTGGAAITGTGTENQVLTAVSTMADPDGLGTLHYQWQRDTGSGFVNVGTDQATYTLGDADVGGVVRVVIRYADGQGFLETATSAASPAIAGVNDAPTGGAAITGTATENQILTADASTLADADGLGTLHYQWQRNTGSGFVNVGADQATYTLGDADVGGLVRVIVSYTDGQGFANSVTSAASPAIAGVNDPHTGGASLTGTATENQVLTAVSTLADVDGLGTLHYDWQRDTGSGFVSTGAADQATYTLGDADVGGLVRVVISYTDGQGFSETATSASSAAIAGVNDAPTGGVSLTGTATENQVLTADASTLADADGLGTLHYQWQRNTGSGFVNVGADQSTYTLGDADVGGLVRVIVSYTDGQGFANSVTSAATSAVASVNDAPTLSLTGTTTTFVEDGAAADLFSGANVVNPESGQELTLRLQVSGVSDGVDEHLILSGVPINLVAGSPFIQPAPGGAVMVQVTSGGPGVLNIIIVGISSNTHAQQILDAIVYRNASQNPTAGDRTVTVVSIADNGGGANLTAVNVSTTVTVSAVNDAAVAVNDANITTETAVVTGTVFTNDSDVDGPALTVSAVNGSAVAVGMQITLPSGALLTLNADGTYSYDPNGAFAYIPGPSSGSPNQTATDTFSYTLANGNSATVTITITGQDTEGDVVTGGSGDDVLTSGGGDDTFVGGAGNDTLSGGAGQDTADYSNASSGIVAGLNTGAAADDGDGGSDTLIDIENLTGSGFDDTLTGAGNENVLSGGGGYDVLVGLGGDDALYGGTGAANEIYGGEGDDTYYIDANDTLVEEVDEGHDTVITTLNAFILRANFEDLTFAGSGNFRGRGNALNNVLTGAAGDDILNGGGGQDRLIGGLGSDTASYVTAAAGIVADLAANAVSNDGDGGSDILTSIENLTGSAFNDSLSGDGSANRLDGGDGDDLLIGRGGNDILRGGDGVDTANYSAAASGIRAQLDTGEVTDGDGGTDYVSGVENIIGTAFNDVIIASTGDNVLNGGAGYDILIGGEGNDTLRGGSGVANELYGGEGDDLYVVDANDTIVELSGEGVDRVETTLHSYTLADNVEHMRFTGSGNFAGQGNALANEITGGMGDDTLTGGGGDDTLDGWSGRDTVVMSGLSTDYTIVHLGGSQYRITDNVGGRDGIDLLNGIEEVRFSNGVTAILNGGVSAPVLFVKDAAGPLVLPGVTSDDFLIGKGDHLPLVQPGLTDNPFEIIPLTPSAPADGLLVAVLEDHAIPGVGHTPGHDDWML